MPDKKLSENSSITAWWTGGYNNWGDIVTPIILSSLSGLPVVRGYGPPSIFSVGSIISNVRQGCSVWGSGLLSPSHVPKPFPTHVTFHAVRGPLTRKMLQKHGLEVPEIYGDPVMLLPYMYRTNVPPTTKIGIIPHYADSYYIKDVLGTGSYKIINILGGFREVLKDVLDCQAIISSSLHGLVLADAYNLQTAWLQIDRGKHLAGREFKFKDYILSTNRKPVVNKLRGKRPLDLYKIKWLAKPEIDVQPLLDSCPCSKYKKISEIPTQVIN